MLAHCGYIGLFLIVAILFALGMALLPVLLGRILGATPYKPNEVKNSTYECGLETAGKSWVQFNFRYYFYALLFVAFDILVIFLFPWAVNLKHFDRSEAIFALIGIVIFILIISVGYIYAWKKKVLEWK